MEFMEVAQEDHEYPEELINALIKFGCNATRTLFIEGMEAWRNFHYSESDYHERWGDYSTEELREVFLHKVLPRITECELTDEQKICINLLDLHPAFIRVENGFKLKAKEERGKRCLKAGIDFQWATAENIDSLLRTSRTPAPTKFVPYKRKRDPSPPHTILYRAEDEHEIIKRETVLNEDSVLVSAVLSSEFELTKSVLLGKKEMLRRFWRAKEKFEDKGEMPVNCKEIPKLLEYMDSVTSIHKAIIRLTYKRMRYN